MRRCIDTVIEDQAVGPVPAEHERKGGGAASDKAEPIATVDSTVVADALETPEVPQGAAPGVRDFWSSERTKPVPSAKPGSEE